MVRIVQSNDFAPSKFKFKEPKLNRHNGKSVFVSYNNTKLLLQTPRMHLPFGASRFQDQNKWTLELSLKGYDEDEEMRKFYENLVDLDRIMCEHGTRSAFKWFGKRNISKDVVEDKYTRLIRFGTNKETGEEDRTYPPKFKVRMYNKRDAETEFDVQCFDLDENTIKLNTDNVQEHLCSGIYLRAIVSPTFVWFASGKFGMSWRVVQVMIEPEAKLKGCYISVEREEEAAVEEEPNSVSTESAPPNLLDAPPNLLDDMLS